MRSNYKRLGSYLREIDYRNLEDNRDHLLGVSTKKIFIESIANTVGTDFKTYKIIKRNQFAYVPDTSRRGDKIGIALLDHLDEGLISQAYIVFEITETKKLLPEYLMMWFRRPEFDRYSRFHSWGSVREIFDWESLCDVKLPIPHPDKQKEIVNEYNTIINRIKLNQQLIQKLEETAQAIYKQWFVIKMDENWSTKRIDEVGEVITGKTPPTENEENFGDFMPFITIPDMHNNAFALKTERSLSEKGVALQKNKTLPVNSICVSCIGTAGLVTMVSEPSQTNQQINSVICHKDFSIYYLFITMKNLRDIIQSHGAKGSVGNNLNKQEFSNLTITYPTDDLLKKFHNIVSPIFENIKFKIKENNKLLEMKDLLLAKLATVEN